MSPGLRMSLRVAWRRNRWFWVWWILGLSVLMPITSSQYDTLLPPGGDSARVLATLAANPAMRAMLGPVYDLSTKGGFVFWRVGGFVTVMAALMAGFAIIRATRAEEEAGRLEMVRAAPVKPHEPFVAAVVVSLVGCVAAGATNTVAIGVLGLPWAGCVAAGAAIACSGALFVGIGALTAQLFASARAARAWTLGAGLGGMYVLRAVIDGLPEDSMVAPLRWAIPLEWGMLVRPFAGDRWWVLLLPVTSTVLVLAVAYRLESIRDHGTGVRASRPGPDTAAAGLAGAPGLAWRLHRTGVLGWAFGLLVAAVLFGSVGAQMDQLAGSNQSVLDVFERLGGSDAITTAFFTGMLSILVTIVAVMAVSILGRIQAEEATGRAELMLATATRRTAYAVSHLRLAIAAPALVLVAVGALLPSAKAVTDSRWEMIGDYALGAAGLLPGLVLVVGLALLVIGWAPRLLPAVWAVLGWSVFTGWFAALFDLPDWLVDLQPWGHLAFMPRDRMSWPPFLVETGIAVVLIVLGLAGFRRRDITSQ
ncbi:MAG: hypothetical protein CSB46_00100 [Micrococcales bacterium]|nr:MAG: hypothetical protein CSB46_00100 [Micrococcales bacterium]